MAIAAGDTECRSPEMNVWLEAGRRYAIGMEWNGATVVAAKPPQKSAVPLRASITGGLSFDSAKGTRQPAPDSGARESPYPFTLELAE